MSQSLTQLYLSNPALATALRQRAMGEQQIQAGTDTSPTNWAGALARLVQAYAGNRTLSGADDKIKGIADQQDQEFRDFNKPPAALPVGTPPAAIPVAPPVAPPLAANGTGADIPPELLPHYTAASQATGIPVAVLAAKDKQESGFRNTLRGGAGEIGIAQVLPSTANAPGYGLSPISPDELAADPAKNIMFGAQYLAARGKAGGVTDWNDPSQVAKGLLAYNGGGDPNYVANVTRYLPPGFGGQRVAAAAPPGAAAPDAGGGEGGGAPDPRAGPPRASPLADVYLQQAMELQRKAQQAAASNNPRIQAQEQALRQQAAFYAGLAKEKPKTNVLRPGGMLVDDQGRVIARAPDDTGPLTPVWDGKERDEKGTPVYRLATRPQGVGQIAPPPGPLLSSNVNIGAEHAESAKRGTDLASEGTAVRNAARASAVTLDNIRTLDSINAETGRLAPAQEVIGGWLDALGIKSDAVRKAKTLQEFNGLVAPLILGEQTKQAGVQTEGDAKRIGQMLGSITNTTEANKFLSRAVEAQARRQLDQANFYDDWYAKNKSYGGAQQAWNRFILDAPLTTRDGNEVVFYNEFAAPLLQNGRSPEQILSAWKSMAQRK